MKLGPSHILLFGCFLLCSCLSTVKDTSEREDDDPDLMERFAGGFSVKKDEDGNMTVVSDKRSSFEGKKYTGDTSSVDKKEYAKGEEVERKKFDGGDTRFATKSWDGNKNYDVDRDAPDFITQAKGLNTGKWADRDKIFETNKSDLQGQSWEDAGKRLSFEDNKEIMDKRKNSKKPKITDSHKAAAKTMKETRELMGRDD